MKSIYLDANATTPLLPEVAEAMQAAEVDSFGNPASQHSFGRKARQAMERAKETIASVLDLRWSFTNSDRILFARNGSEANALALAGMVHFAPLAHETPAITATKNLLSKQVGFAQRAIFSAIEHPSASAFAKSLERAGWHIDYIPPDKRGVLQIDSPSASSSNLICLQSVISETTRFVCLQLGNQETGVIHPIEIAGKLCSDFGVPLHTDAVQVVGKRPISFQKLNATTLSLSAHKFHGPQGVGALILRDAFHLQEKPGYFSSKTGFAGTPSVPLIVGLAKALELANKEMESSKNRLSTQQALFEKTILAGWPEAVVSGAEAESARLCYVSNIAFPPLNRQMLVMALDAAGVACSTGSACASGSSEPSPTLLAMNSPQEVISSAIRFSFSALTSSEEMAEAANRILFVCNKLRQQELS